MDDEYGDVFDDEQAEEQTLELEEVDEEDKFILVVDDDDVLDLEIFSSSDFTLAVFSAADFEAASFFMTLVSLLLFGQANDDEPTSAAAAELRAELK